MSDTLRDLGFPFTDVGGDRVYSSEDWRLYFDALVTGGILGAITNELQVKPQVVANKSIFVDTGAIMIQGAMRKIESTQTLTIADNISGNPRIDRIVVRLNYADRKIEFAVVQGIPGASPSAPLLVRDTNLYEYSLAKVAVANGFSTIVVGNITDERSDETLCGYFKYRAKPAWYPGGEVPLDAWMYTIFKAQLTPQEITDIEINPSLMAIINSNSVSPTESYMVFCANVNSTSLDAAFGKLNENRISSLGKQISMYGWFKGLSISTYPFSNLYTKSTFLECLSDYKSLAEIVDEDNYLMALINASPYAKSVYQSVLETDVLVTKTLAVLTGLNPDSYANMSALANSSPARTAILADAVATKFANQSDLAAGKILAATAGLDAASYANATAVSQSSTAMTAIMASTPACTYAFATSMVLNRFAKNSAAKTALITAATTFNTYKTAMVATLAAAVQHFAKTVYTSISMPSTGAPATIIVGTSNSFVHSKSFVDSSAAGYFISAKHNHNLVEIVRTAFPGASGTGTVSPDVFAVGGLEIKDGDSQGALYYTADKYEAL